MTHNQPSPPDMWGEETPNNKQRGQALMTLEILTAVIMYIVPIALYFIIS